MTKKVAKKGQSGQEVKLSKAEKMLMQATKALLDAAPPLAETGDWELGAEGQSLVEQWAASAIITKQLKAQLELDADLLVGSVLPLYIKRWLANQAPPKNPRLVAPRAMCHFILKPTQLTVVVPKTLKTVEAALQQVGLTPIRAKVFAKFVQVKKEQDFVASLPAMLGHEVAVIREAAQSLFTAIQANEQWKLLLSPTSRFVVKNPETFVQQLPQKAKSVQEMGRVLKVIQPSMYPYQPIHTAPEAAVETRRVWERQAQRVFFSPNNRYKIVAQDKKVFVFVRSQGDWQFVGITERPNSTAARTFAAEAVIDAEKLAAILAMFNG
jgi:hypothetical protein